MKSFVLLTIDKRYYEFAHWAVDRLGYHSPEHFLGVLFEQYLRKDMDALMMRRDQGIMDEHHAERRDYDGPPVGRDHKRNRGGRRPPYDPPPDLDDDIPF